jgi:hypothetical protein
MTWSHRIRQSHRWVSIAFTLTVIANFVVRGMDGGKEPPAWITYSPLLPLAVLLFTGLYLFALPYAARRRGELPNREVAR